MSIVIAAVHVGSALADAGSPTIVFTVHGDPGDYVTHGQTTVLRSQTSAVSFGTLSTSQISASIGNWEFTFATDPKAPFVQGPEYGELADTQSQGGRAYQPITAIVSGNGRGCDQVGTIRMNDLQATGTSITRLDLTFVLHCGDALPAMFGELQINEPQFPDATMSSDHIVQWPDTDPRTHATPVDITTTNTGSDPQTVGTPDISGHDVHEFALSSDNCPGSLAPGQSCDTVVDFWPGGAGPRAAILDRDIAGLDSRVLLLGAGSDGDTEMDIDGSYGDGLTQGEQIVAVPEDAATGVAGDRAGFTFSSSEGVITVTSESHASLTPGTYKTGPSGSFDFYLEAANGDCLHMTGTLTVRQAAYDGVDGSTARFDAYFSETCASGHTPVTGRLRYNATTAETDPITLHATQPSTYGTLVTVHGHSAPTADITVIGRERGTTRYTTLTHTVGDTTGAFTFTVRADNDYSLIAEEPTRFGSASTLSSPPVAVTIAPTLTQHGTIRPRLGQSVTLTGTANPHEQLLLITQPFTHARTTHRTLTVSSTGHWSFRSYPRRAVHVHVTSSNHASSNAVAIEPSGS